MNEADTTEWQVRLHAAAHESARRRAARSAARREAAERRRRGMSDRHAWRLTRRDARLAQQERGAPG